MQLASLGSVKRAAHGRKRSPAIPSTLTKDAIRQQLERTLASDLFARAERLSSFLKYIVDQALEGNPAELKEYSIARAVYERGDDFDSRLDPIVRVEAGRLRAKIREYYDTTGKDDPIWIGPAKRGYKPIFRRRRKSDARDTEHQEKGKEAPSSTGANAAPDKAEKPSLAVLPFADLSQERNQRYFCEALADQIISELAKIRSLLVTGHTSTKRFREAAEDIREVGRQLKVDGVLEGSVQRVNSSVRVNVRLLSTATGFDLWGETYDRPLEDVLGIQDEITQAVVEGLKAVLLKSHAGGKETEPVNRSERTNSPGTERKAYDEYLKGLYHWNKQTEPELRKSIEHFEACIQSAHDYAPAHAGLSACYLTLSMLAASEPEEVMTKARGAAVKALELDPGNAKAKSCEATIKALYEWDWAGAKGLFEEARELDPNEVTTYQWQAIAYLAPLGSLDAALESMTQAHELKPASVIVNAQLGLLHYYRREYQRAIRQSHLAIEMEPGFYRAHWDLGRAYLQDCDLSEALSAFEEAHDLTNGMFRYGALGHCYAASDRKKRAEKVLEELLDARAQRHVSSYEIAEVYLGLKDYDQMFEWLDKARQERSPWLSWIAVDPVFDEIRADKRFKDLTQQLGLRATADRLAAERRSTEDD